jgi:hypothetical protein
MKCITVTNTEGNLFCIPIDKILYVVGIENENKNDDTIYSRIVLNNSSHDYVTTQDSFEEVITNLQK